MVYMIYMIYCNQDPLSPPTIFYLPSPPLVCILTRRIGRLSYGYLQSAPAPVDEGTIRKEFWFVYTFSRKTPLCDVIIW
jgi:hypothetical protein